MKYIFKYKYSLIVAVFILYLSLIKPPKLDIEILDFKYFDKLVHIFMYAFLTSFILFETNNINKCRYNFIIFSISTIFGGAIEILQNYFPPRTATWGDFIADAIGSALPFVILVIIKFYYYERKQKGKANSSEPD